MTTTESGPATKRLDATTARFGLPIIYKPGGNLRPIKDAAAAGAATPKASEIVAAAIIKDIVQTPMSIGDRLPSEPEMLEQYGVSRESLREGLRILEVQGLISIRRGPGGGPYVAPVNARYLARTASLYFKMSGATYHELFETWLDLEPMLAAKVARVPDRARKRAAFGPFLHDESYSLAHDDATFEELNDFHSVVAELSGNRVATLITQAVTHIVVDHVVENVDPFDIPHLDHDHGLIAVALIEGRPRKASNLMAEHISGVVEYYRKHLPHSLGEPIEWL
jgi:GntR family transcriptional regulator, transcriptional repressor for pyruvate dehydrogenase complex